MHRALITGGTSGIGAAFAREFAKRRVDLVLVARNADRLSRFAQDLRTRYDIDVEEMVCDLEVEAERDRVAARLTQESIEHPAVDILVNNAGFSVRSDILGDDLSLHDSGIEVMIKAVLHLSNAAGRAMARRGTGWIINVNSVSGYLPQNNYSAIKSWGNTYTEALAVRLAGSGVHVTSLQPGWVRTEFHERPGISGSSIPDFLWLSPERLVKECLDDVARGKLISVPSKRFKVLAFLARTAPRNIMHSIAAWFTKRRDKEKPLSKAPKKGTK